MGDKDQGVDHRVDPIREEDWSAPEHYAASARSWTDHPPLRNPAYHHVPFYVAAPSSTFDFSIDSGKEIPIEHRDAREVTHGFGKQTAPEGVQVHNPAFDVTPAQLIAAFITERGVIRPPYRENLKSALRTPSSHGVTL